MSRTHLYKLLDCGEIPSHRVGRDRRIYLQDIYSYQQRRDSYNKRLAEDFSQQSTADSEATDELAELL